MRSLDESVRTLDKSVQGTIEKIEEITQESVELVNKAVEGTLNTLGID